jgi:hypothetical protein
MMNHDFWCREESRASFLAGFQRYGEHRIKVFRICPVRFDIGSASIILSHYLDIVRVALVPVFQADRKLDSYQS